MGEAMHNYRCFGAVTAALLLLGTVPAWAGGIVSEVRLGVLAHDVGVLGGREGGVDVNGEVLFVSPFSSLAATSPAWLHWLLTPRPDLGASINTEGKTSQGYGGLTWSVPLLPRLLGSDDAVGLDLGVGGEVNNGLVNPNRRHRKALGSNVLFRLSAEVTWRVTRRVGVSALFDHVSNAGLAPWNESINDIGGRLDFHF